MARTRSLRYDDQRALILDRAAALFAERGYVATSLNEVAQACGISKAALYHYFADKDGLLLEIVDRHVARLVARVHACRAEHLARGGEGGAPLLRALVSGLVQEYADARDAHRVLTEDVRFLAPTERQRVLDGQREVVQVFADEVRRLRPEAEPAQLVKPLTMLLFGMVNWMFTWHRANGPVSQGQLAPIVGDLFVAGIAAITIPAAPAGVAARGDARGPKPGHATAGAAAAAPASA